SGFDRLGGRGTVARTTDRRHLQQEQEHDEDRLNAQRREERPARHSTLSCRASGAAQRRVSTTPRCASPATTLSSFSWIGTNLVPPGTEAARFTSFHLS